MPPTPAAATLATLASASLTQVIFPPIWCPTCRSSACTGFTRCRCETVAAAAGGGTQRAPVAAPPPPPRTPTSCCTPAARSVPPPPPLPPLCPCMCGGRPQGASEDREPAEGGARERRGGSQGARGGRQGARGGSQGAPRRETGSPRRDWGATRARGQFSVRRVAAVWQ